MAIDYESNNSVPKLDLEEDSKARTSSYFVNRPSLIANYDEQAYLLIKNLERIMEPHGKRVGRLNLHKPNSEDLHVMLISEDRHLIKPIKRHQYRSKLYVPLIGKMSVLLFNDDLSLKSECVLNRDSGSPFLWIAENTIHTTIMESDFGIYLEVIRGPFERKSDHTEYINPMESDDNGESFDWVLRQHTCP